MPQIQIKTASLERYLEGGGGKYRFLIFGTPGSGKTPFAAQFPKPLFLMADRGGENSLVLTKTPYIEIRSEKDMLDTLDWLAKESTRPSFEYETIVIDTYSVLQSHVIQGILKREGKKNLDGFGNWGELGSAMKTILDRTQNINAHLVVNVHLKDKFDSEEFEPDLVGSAKVDLPKEFPYIGWLHTEWDVDEKKKEKKVVRKITWRATPKFPILRSASNVLPQETPVTFSPADFEVIRDAIRKGAAAVGGTATVTEVDASGEQSLAVGPDVQGGPVAPKAPAKKTTRAKKAEPVDVELPADPRAAVAAEVEQQDAVALVQDQLGGEVVAEESTDPLLAGIYECDSVDALKAYYLAHKGDPGWTREHTGHVSELKAALLSA